MDPKRLYADEIERLYELKYANLIRFLRMGFQAKRPVRPNTSRDTHQLWIGDYSNGSFSTRCFKAQPPLGNVQVSVDPDFRSALHDWPSDVTCRVVLSTCRHMFDVNQAYIDELAHVCNLSPDMLSSLFDRLGRRHKWQTDDSLQLPSEREYIQLAVIDDLTLTAAVQQSSRGCLIVIFCMGVCKFSVTEEYSVIGALDTHLKAAPSGAPLDILFSVTRCMVLRAEHIRRILATSIDTKIEKSTVHMVQCQRQRDDLVDSHTSLKEYLLHNSAALGGFSTRMAAIEAEYLRAIDRISAMIADRQAYMQQAVALKSIEEANRGIEETRRGIKQAESVRRLTMIAFVFIPLNFATSFFGMNIKQLNSGTLSIGYFFLVAVLAALVAYVLSAAVRPLETLWPAYRDKVSAAALEDHTTRLINKDVSRWWVRYYGVKFWIGWHWKAFLDLFRSAPPPVDGS